MKLRALFTFAILAGLAAAPAAQTFRWKAGDSDYDRVSRSIERAMERAERTLDRVRREVERSADRIRHRVEVRLRSFDAGDQTRAGRDLARQIREDLRVSVRDFGRSFRTADRVRGDAQDFSSDPCARRNRGRDDDEQACEVRDQTLGAGGAPVRVQTRNGGVKIGRR